MKKYLFAAAMTSLLAACGGGSSTVATVNGDGTSAGAASGDVTSGVNALANQTPINEINPAPPSIGADVPVTYFGTAPSTVQKELVGPLQLLLSGTVDLNNGTITLPLYEGSLGSTGGTKVWYIVTDVNDKGQAEALGLNYASKLSYAPVNRAGIVGARNGNLEVDGNLNTMVFEKGSVDFRPVHSVTPAAAPNYFPPAAAQPGSVGDADYTPLVRMTNNGFVYNMPAVSQGTTAEQLNVYCDSDVDLAGHTLIHDKVTRICPRDGTVTITLTTGFSFDKPVLYMSTDSNDPVAASLEASTLAPAMNALQIGGDDSFASPVERLFATINGAVNDQKDAGGNTERNPQRQGFNSALRGEGSPLNVLGGIPTVATDYSPMWDVNIGQWTQTAIDRGYRAQVREEFEILGLVQRGFITGPNGSAYGSSGIVVNCPIVMRLL